MVQPLLEEYRLTSQVSVPDRQVLREPHVAPEDREGEHQLPEVVELVLPPHIVEVVPPAVTLGDDGHQGEKA